MDTLAIDTGVVYVSMIKRVKQSASARDTSYHVYRFFNNGVFYSKVLTTRDSLINEMNHPCRGGKWGMYTLEKDAIIMESEERIDGELKMKYTHGIIDENELYLDHYKVGKILIKLGGEDTFTTYLKTPIKIQNWYICWRKLMASF
ncbi:MAG: hypothetical protein JKY42_03555 [Flavobacteriales bacterium]|nr:hypothetical protein [Flavobacteriales bacterium]